MPLQVVPVTAEHYPAVNAFLRRSPYRNAITLAFLYRRNGSVSIRAALSNHVVVGVAAVWHDGSPVRLSFTVDVPQALPMLLEALAMDNPELWNRPFEIVMPVAHVPLLTNTAHLESVHFLYQMVVEPETLHPIAQPPARRIQKDDVQAVKDLRATAAPWQIWTPDSVPAFGVFAADGSLLATAVTCFATGDVVELGWAMQTGSLPALQSALSALIQSCFSITSRVYLFVDATDSTLFDACRRLGFWPAERFIWATTRL
ncbi:hypothetical protein [Chloroflexus sp.]|nr:hypothetical protein [Chloroflexus sp.]